MSHGRDKEHCSTLFEQMVIKYILLVPSHVAAQDITYLPGSCITDRTLHLQKKQNLSISRVTDVQAHTSKNQICTKELCSEAFHARDYFVLLKKCQQSCLAALLGEPTRRGRTQQRCEILSKFYFYTSFSGQNIAAPSEHTLMFQ